MTTTLIAPPTPKLFVTSGDPLTIVHRMQDGLTCTVAAQARMRRYVSPVQVLVYGLVSCGRDLCFPRVDEFERIVGRSRT